MKQLVLDNARLVLADEVIHGHVCLVRGRIAEIGQGRSRAPGAVDLAGDLLLPGLVELHTDNLERHAMPRPRVHFPIQGALLAHDAEIAAAGITTVFDAIGIGDPYDEGFRAQDQSALLGVLTRLEHSGLLRCNHLLHLRCELPAPNTLALFEPFMHDPHLALISLMDHTPGQRQWQDTEHARIYYTGKKGWSDAKFARELELAPQRQAAHAAPNRAALLQFARERRLPLASHDDTTLAHVDEAIGDGFAMSEFPTTLAAARHAHQHGLITIAGAPNVLRGGSHSGNVAAIELARAGVLDALSSDYVPSSLLQAAWRLQHDAGLSLPAAVAGISRTPAHACGLLDRGKIAPGLRADLVRVAELGHHPVVRETWLAGQRTA